MHKNRISANYGEHNGVNAADVRNDCHFKGGRSGAGDRDHGTDAQDKRAHEYCGRDLAQTRGDGLAAADAQERKHCAHSQTDVCNKICREAAEPLGTCLNAEIRRKNNVACAKKHRKQRKADDDNVADSVGFVLKLHSIFLFHQLLSHLLSSASVNTLHTVTLQSNALKNVNKGYHFFHDCGNHSCSSPY